MLKRSIPALLLALLMSGSAVAEDTAPPAPSDAAPATESPVPAETQAEKEDDQKIVCKKMDPPLGSRMGGKKVCHTVAEWRRINETAKDTVNEIQTKDTRGPPGN